VTATNNRDGSEPDLRDACREQRGTVEAEVVMFASARVREPEATPACTRERFLSPHVEVETYAGSVLPMQLRRASLVYAVAQELRRVAAELP
jgi:hypothetical protein